MDWPTVRLSEARSFLPAVTISSNRRPSVRSPCLARRWKTLRKLPRVLLRRVPPCKQRAPKMSGWPGLSCSAIESGWKRWARRRDGSWRILAARPIAPWPNWPSRWLVPFDECFVTIAETAVAPLASLWWRSSRAGLVLCQRMVQREELERDSHQCRESDRWWYRQDAYGYLARGEVPGGREARCDFESRLPRHEWDKRRNRVDEVPFAGPRLIWSWQKPLRRGAPARIAAVHRRFSFG